ncbi:hypothetical protein Bca4012_038343 [Brassica carinata]|uniref:Uncharacterized protein n=1 Tax=Brassica carinata TaxID=52824 RepID=A0A8X8B6A1_BRACI|nr:hypothetical protein Bca52824_006723 [Brassica carinata]
MNRLIFDEATVFYATSNGPKCWLAVVDLASGLDGCKGVTPWQELRYIVMELVFNEERLSDRPSLIEANKIDENGADERLEELEIEESQMSENISGFCGS